MESVAQVRRIIVQILLKFLQKFAYDYNFMCGMPGIDQKVDYNTLN